MTINTAYFTQIADQAALCRTCPELQALADRALPQLQDLLDAIAAQEAVLAGAQELLTLNPANITQVISFIGKLQSEFLTPMLAAYSKVVAQATETATAVTSTIAAIENAAAAIPNCTIAT
jgi:hypothetical protein